MKRITAGVLITRSPGATVHVARVESTAGWIALCGERVYRPSTEAAHLTGARCETCKALEKA